MEIGRRNDPGTGHEGAPPAEASLAAFLAQAERISDASLRQMFLEKVPFNQEIIAAWEDQSG